MISNVLTSINPIKVSSIKELFDIITEENKEGNRWFRGQNNIEYPLIPSVLRNAVIVSDQFKRPVEPRKIEVFSTHGDNVLIPDRLYLNNFKKFLDKENIKTDASDIEFICLAQHYGVKTRLLDWSSDAIVALFFAIDGREPGNSAGFYILNPLKLNNVSLVKNVMKYDDLYLNEEFVFPVAFYGPHKDKRMCRQSGNFTIHGQMVWPVDYLYMADEFLKRIEISDELCCELEHFLLGCGINRKSIYVEDSRLDEISKKAQEETENAYNKKIHQLREEWLKSPEKGISTHLYFKDL